MEKKKLNRLESLDVLRGFDLFCLVVLEMVLHPLAHAIDMPWFNSFMWGFSHVEWEGFSTWDLVMPVFFCRSQRVQTPGVFGGGVGPCIYENHKGGHLAL